MPHIKYDDLSEDVQLTIAQLQVDVDELKFESNIYRWAALISLLMLAERIWDRFFA
jgi:hypothetical protein